MSAFAESVESQEAAPSGGSAATTEDVEAGCYAILHSLTRSPLMMWVDINDVSRFLMDDLPGCLHRDVLDLNPLWEHLLKTPGLEEDTAKPFFLGLVHDNVLPWTLRLPHAFGATATATFDPEESDVHVSLADASQAYLESAESLRQAMMALPSELNSERKATASIPAQVLSPIEESAQTLREVSTEAIRSQIEARTLHDAEQVSSSLFTRTPTAHLGSASFSSLPATDETASEDLGDLASSTMVVNDNNAHFLRTETAAFSSYAVTTQESELSQPVIPPFARKKSSFFRSLTKEEELLVKRDDQQEHDSLASKDVRTETLGGEVTSVEQCTPAYEWFARTNSQVGQEDVRKHLQEESGRNTGERISPTLPLGELNPVAIPLPAPEGCTSPPSTLQSRERELSEMAEDFASAQELFAVPSSIVAPPKRITRTVKVFRVSENEDPDFSADSAMSEAQTIPDSFVVPRPTPVTFAQPLQTAHTRPTPGAFVRPPHLSNARPTPEALARLTPGTFVQPKNRRQLSGERITPPEVLVSPAAETRETRSWMIEDLELDLESLIASRPERRSASPRDEAESFVQTAWVASKIKAPIGEMEESISLIQSVLVSSPLALWVKPEGFHTFLEKHLSEFIQAGVLDLEPLWDALLAMPGVQRDVLEIFFDELVRQELPWRMCLPLELRHRNHFRTEAQISRSDLGAASVFEKELEDEFEQDFLQKNLNLPLVAPKASSTPLIGKGDYEALSVDSLLADLGDDVLAELDSILVDGLDEEENDEEVMFGIPSNLALPLRQAACMEPRSSEPVGRTAPPLWAWVCAAIVLVWAVWGISSRRSVQTQPRSKGVFHQTLPSAKKSRAAMLDPAQPSKNDENTEASKTKTVPKASAKPVDPNADDDLGLPTEF